MQPIGPTRPDLQRATFGRSGAAFADPALERSFARHRLLQTGRGLAVVAGVCAAAWLLLAPADWPTGDAVGTLCAAAGRLIAGVILGAAAVALWMRAEWLSEPRGRRLLTLATLALAAAFLLVVGARDADPRHLDVSAALFGTGVLLFVPIPLARRTAAVAGSYASFWLLAVLQHDAAPARLAVNLVVAMVGGLAGAVHLERGARREYLLLVRLQRLNGDLSAQVSHHVSVEQVLTRLASEDELTGLLNRRAFFAAVGDAVDRDGRVSETGAAILVDADRFKAINDDHGHDTGDRVLKDVASTLAGAVRTGDLVARIGGEEFAVYLPGAGLDEARRVAERIRAAVAARSWPVVDGSVSVTVSVGVAERGSCEPLDDLVRRADRAMYRSKRAGGDRLACDTLP